MNKTLSVSQLVPLRRKSLDEATRLGLTAPQSEGFTCDDCESRFDCEYVYDLYNTFGDCLAGK